MATFRKRVNMVSTVEGSQRPEHDCPVQSCSYKGPRIPEHLRSCHHDSSGKPQYSEEIIVRENVKHLVSLCPACNGAYPPSGVKNHANICDGPAIVDSNLSPTDDLQSQEPTAAAEPQLHDTCTTTAAHQRPQAPPPIPPPTLPPGFGGGPGGWLDDESVDMVNMLSVQDVCRFEGRCSDGIVSAHARPLFAAAVEKSMSGMADDALSEMGWKIHMWSARLLKGPRHERMQDEGTFATEVIRRSKLFLDGHLATLDREVKATPFDARVAAQGPRSDAQIERHVTRLAQQGLLAKATQGLEPSRMVPATIDSRIILGALFPSEGEDTEDYDKPTDAQIDTIRKDLKINPSAFRQVFESAPRGSAHGPSGWRFEDYSAVARHAFNKAQEMQDPSDVTDSALYKVVLTLARGRIPTSFLPYYAGGRLIGLEKPNKTPRPIVIGEALRRLTGKCLFKTVDRNNAMAKHFVPRLYDVHPVKTQPVVAAQLGVAVKSGLDMGVLGTIGALQCHPISTSATGCPGWVLVQLDLRNFFNSIKRGPMFKALLSNPEFRTLYPQLAALYAKRTKGRLWVDLGEGEWEDILAQIGVQQGCVFGSFLSALGLQPILDDVASNMKEGMLWAYCDDIHIISTPMEASQAYYKLVNAIKQELGVDEATEKSSVSWFGDDASESTPELNKALATLPQNMRGVTSRVQVQKCLGVFLENGTQESAEAVEAALAEKLEEKAKILQRLEVIPDPKIRHDLIKWCISTRPSHWMRLMSPSVTKSSAAAFDVEVNKALELIHWGGTSDHARTLERLPTAFGGEGVISCTDTRDHAHYNAWLQVWGKIEKLWPTALQVQKTDLEHSNLPFAAGLREARNTLESHANFITASTKTIPVPMDAAKKHSKVPELKEIGEHTPDASELKILASLTPTAQYTECFQNGDLKLQATMVSNWQKGSGRGLHQVPKQGFQMEASHYVAAKQRRVRVPLSCLSGFGGKSCPLCKGGVLDEMGDHVRCCSGLLHLRTEEHDAIQRKVQLMAREGKYVVRDVSKKHRKDVRHYSPLHVPDTKLVDGSKTGHHVLIDYTTTQVTSEGISHAAATTPLAAAKMAEDTKYGDYGNVAPHTVLPFAVEDGGGLGPQALAFVERCRVRSSDQLSARSEALTSWTCSGFTNFHLASISFASARGLGRYFVHAANLLQDGFDRGGGAGGGAGAAQASAGPAGERR